MAPAGLNFCWGPPSRGAGRGGDTSYNQVSCTILLRKIACLLGPMSLRLCMPLWGISCIKADDQNKISKNLVNSRPKCTFCAKILSDISTSLKPAYFAHKDIRLINYIHGLFVIKLIFWILSK